MRCLICGTKPADGPADEDFAPVGGVDELQIAGCSSECQAERWSSTGCVGTGMEAVTAIESVDVGVGRQGVVWRDTLPDVEQPVNLSRVPHLRPTKP